MDLPEEAATIKIKVDAFFMIAAKRTVKAAAAWAAAFTVNEAAVFPVYDVFRPGVSLAGGDDISIVSCPIIHSSKETQGSKIPAIFLPTGLYNQLPGLSR